MGAVSTQLGNEDVRPTEELHAGGQRRVGSAVKGGVEGVFGDGEISGAGGAEDVELVVVVDVQTVRNVCDTASDVSGVVQVTSRGIELGDGHIHLTGKVGLVGAERGWVPDAESDAAAVEVTVCVVGGGITPVVSGGARKRREDHRRVYDQRQGGVVLAEGERHDIP